MRSDCLPKSDAKQPWMLRAYVGTYDLTCIRQALVVCVVRHIQFINSKMSLKCVEIYVKSCCMDLSFLVAPIIYIYITRPYLFILLHYCIKTSLLLMHIHTTTRFCIWEYSCRRWLQLSLFFSLWLENTFHFKNDHKAKTYIKWTPRGNLNKYAQHLKYKITMQNIHWFGLPIFDGHPLDVF